MNETVSAIGALGLLLVYEGILNPRRGPRSRVVVRCEALLAEAGFSSAGAAQLLMACFGTGFLAALAAALLVPSVVVMALAVAGGASIPFSYLRRRRYRRRRTLREAWPDALATLIASIRAGASLPEACASLSRSGPHELRPFFAAFRDTYRATGSLEAALQRLCDQIADPIADRVVAALTLAHQVGGSDLVRVLRTLGDFVREDLRARKEIEARWSWTVTAARVAAAAPWIVLAMMSTRPEAARAYGSTAGTAAICCGALATVAGYRLMLRAARLPEDRRFVR